MRSPPYGPLPLELPSWGGVGAAMLAPTLPPAVFFSMSKDEPMQIPLELSYRHLEPSASIDSFIRERVDRLDRPAARLTSCRVMCEMPHRSQNRGNLYHIRIDLTLPGGEIVVDRNPPAHQAHEELGQAVGEAFDEAERRLNRFLDLQRGDVKRREASPRGHVVELFPGEGYGFLESSDGMRVYFHENSVLRGGFGGLDLGSEVKFEWEQGDQGPQAVRVAPTGRTQEAPAG